MSFGSALLLLVLLQTTTPGTIGPLGILIVFILMYIASLGAMTFLLFKGSQIFVRFSRLVTVTRPFQALSLGRSYYFSTVIALAPVILVGMESVGNLGINEVGLVAIFVIIGCMYVAKRSH
jgi:uncharacterized membrane protein